MATQTQPQQGARHEANNTQVARLIGSLLRVGVIVSLSLVVLGVMVTFAQHPQYLRSAESLREITDGQAGLPRTAGQLRAYVRESAGRVIVLAGLLVLIATPVLRVLLSMLLFVRHRDWAYVALTCAVLVLLLVSFLSGMN